VSVKTNDQSGYCFEQLQQQLALYSQEQNGEREEFA